MSHLDRLMRLVPLKGLDVLDIGAGDGGVAARMAEAGARVTGVEIDTARVARAADRIGDRVTMVEGRAEALPVSDAGFDLATFFFSLHHVPVALHDAALSEVARVLRPEGWVFVVEPLPEGPMFELVKPVDDETAVREAAQTRLMAIAESDARFTLIARELYTTERSIPDLQSFLDRLVSVDPVRAAKLPAARETLLARFAAAPRDAKGAALMAQPCVACLFRRV